MSMYYCHVSESRGGFFDTRIHGEIGDPDCSIPEGAFEISDDSYTALMTAAGQGQLIIPGADGYPVAVKSLSATAYELASIERAWRDSCLSTTDGVVSRHRDELEEGVRTTLAAEQYAELQTYRRALREWPQGENFPLIEHRPSAPIWLAAFIS